MKSWGEQEFAAAWSGLAEPGDRWAGALRSALGDEAAFRWASAPFIPPPFEVEAPSGQGGDSRGGWRAAHERWGPRLQTLNPRQDLEELGRLGGRLVLPGQREWPSQLDDLGNRCPPALWVLGAGAAPLPHRCVSIVGARAATTYGAEAARNAAYDLVRAGVRVVSGGAYGVDAAAHSGALDRAEETRTTSEFGKSSTPWEGEDERAQESYACPTVAVVCGGLRELYPAGNGELFGRILELGGLVVAEVPPSFRPARWRFLERNRLIAAWSDVTVVVEAGLRSGALATANRAVDLGRDVAAVPGPVTSYASAGPHSLIKDGAALVECGRDILDLMGLDAEAGKVEPPVKAGARVLGPVAERVWDALPLLSGASAESVARVSGLSSKQTRLGLHELQRSGRASQRDGLWLRASPA